MKIELKKADSWYGVKYPKDWKGEVINSVGTRLIKKKSAVEIQTTPDDETLRRIQEAVEDHRGE